MTAEDRTPRAPPSASPSLEDLLVGALDSLERDGPDGLARFLTSHPDVASRLHRHLLHLHEYGFVAERSGWAAPPTRGAEPTADLDATGPTAP